MKQLTDRMRQRNGRSLYQTAVWLCCLMAACSWGCTIADVEDEHDIPVGEQLQVEIPVTEVPLQQVDPMDTKAVPDSTKQRLVSVSDSTEQQQVSVPVTRAAATYKRAIVLQYSADGNTLLNAGSTDIDTYTIGSSVSAKLVAATDCKIYVWAVNETTTTGAGTTFNTEAKLLAATYDLYTKFSSPTDADIPLIGSISGINVVRMASGSGQIGVIQDPTSANSKVMLSRIAAKLDIRLFYNLPGFSITPATATLANVPQTFYLFGQSGTVFPAESSAAAFGTVSVPLTSYDGDKTDESATQYVRYVPMNRRGTNGSIAYPKDKWSGTAPRTIIDRCTYLKFTASNKKTPSHKLVYSFYFGGNNTTDFNILRNHIYTMNSTILQRSEGDNRITEAGLSPVVITEPTAESVSSNAATIKGTITDKRGIAVTSYGFYYKAGAPFSEPANPAKDGTKVGEKSADLAAGTPFSHALTGLSTSAVYYFIAYAATSTNGTSYGEPAVFSTNAAGLPVLGTQSQLVSAADGRSVSSSGNTITGGGALSNGVVYSTQSGFDHLTSGTRANGTPAGGTPYSVSITGLIPGSTYYYRYFASNASGFVYGNAQQSVRLFDVPALSNAAAVTSTVVGTLRFAATTAKKNTADALPTAAGVKLWTTNPGSNLGSAAITTVPYASPTVVGAKTADWTSMTAGQTYWYASYATNLVGSGYSTLQSFTASQALTPGTPSVTSLGPQAVTGITLATTSRNTKATVSNGATVTAGDNTASKTISISNYTTATTPRTPTIVLTTIGELPLRTATTTITQYGVVFPALFAAVANVAYGGVGATNTPVTANIPWAATSDAAWCTLGAATQTGANTQNGDARNFTYAVAANTGGASRTATVTVKGTGDWASFSRTFTISQLAATLSIDKANMTAGPQSVDHTLTVTSNTTWSAASNATSVATVNASTSTAGNGNRTISTVNNTTAGSSRAATITVTPTHGTAKSYTITQYGVVFPTSLAAVANVSKAGQSATNVSVTANIPWTATSNQTWCTIASGTQTGANTQAGSALNFSYTVAKNTGAARSATITVAGTGDWKTGFIRTFTVSQLAGGQVIIKPGDPTNDNSNVDFKK